jgi:hypothetical protein
MQMQHHNTTQYSDTTVPSQNTLQIWIFLEVPHADISLTCGVLILGIIKGIEG